MLDEAFGHHGPQRRLVVYEKEMCQSFRHLRLRQKNDGDGGGRQVQTAAAAFGGAECAFMNRNYRDYVATVGA
jgi:hypothetical protein